MVAFRAISTALAVAAVAQPFGALAKSVDFADNYVQPGSIKPLTKSYGYQFENFDILGGVLNDVGEVVEDLLATLGAVLGLNGHHYEKTKYGHGVGIVRGIDGHYNEPGRIYHSDGKNFNVHSLKALCCAADMSKKCEILDCHIKLSGYDKPVGGNKIYDHDFYVPKSYNSGNKDIAPIDIDVSLDGIVNLGVVGIDLSALVVDIELLDLVDIEVNTDKKHRGRYNYKPSHQHGVLGLGLIIDIDLEL
ncbi:hypothetical protein Dda_6533 [Drechslerella dactyloides]|uniref:Uncharacterized protein n=1 Tax=Drechslerella dactyloides TaxID=74499 RepID=A0AAD6NGA5_DREDA|nr:hypothetical protein Dda_6533 [Drechslerella dactyloides]